MSGLNEVCNLTETCIIETQGYDLSDKGFETRAVLAGQDPDQWSYGVVVPPIYNGVVFKLDGTQANKGYIYGRTGNPTRSSLQDCLANLDNAKYAFAFLAGLTTVTGVCELLNIGDHVICGDDVYGGTHKHFRTIGKTHGLEVDYVDTTDVGTVEKAIKPNTKLVWIESLTNPLLKVTDIPSLAGVLKAKNQSILFAIDNTILTSYYLRPLDLGADIVSYSLTKYMNGHVDVVMGALTTNDDVISKRIASIQNTMGLVPSPFDCYLTNRGLKTLAVKMDKHTQNATEIAKYLEQHPLIEKVIYPGLKSHPQYELVRRMCTGTSGMIACYIKGDINTSKAFVKALRLFTLAGSLGGYQSLAELPAVLSHSSIPEDMRKELGITDNLVRLHIGLETARDLMKDINQALKIAAEISQWSKY